MKRLFLYICFVLASIAVEGQKNCNFSVMQDSSICGPQEVELYISGSNIDKVKWFGDGFVTSDTNEVVTVQVDSTTTFYVTNRIPDPQNLITNGDFEMGNTAFTSDYESSCINGQMPQGKYCINTNSGLYWSTWKPCGDHTSGSGNMYITDGAVVADEKIWCQTVAVEQHTDYEFSSWLTTVLDLNNAILQFTINDVQIGDPFEASNEECEWNEFFQIWNSQTVTSAEICITNQNAAADGNDFAIDDIRFNKVCYSEDSITITVVDDFEVSINEDTTICPGDAFIVEADSTFSNNFVFEWEDGNTNSSKTVDQTGTYSLVVTSPEGCSASDTMEVFRIANPTSTLMGDTAICFSIFGDLPLYAGAANKVIWEHPSGEDTIETLMANEPGNYMVTLYNGDNCFVIDRLTIEDFCSTELFIPNSFTPNNDGLNDEFGAISIEAYSYELIIFNRWGKEIFTSNSLNNTWKGTDAPMGTYAYSLVYTVADRDGGALKETKKFGSVTLIR